MGWGEQHIGVVMHPANQPSMLEAEGLADDADGDDDDQEEGQEDN